MQQGRLAEIGELHRCGIGAFAVGSPCKDTAISARYSPCMAHTYGEVLALSFPDIFSFAQCPEQTVFIDAGSGYGALLVASIREYGCQHALGVEKYRDKYAASLDLVSQLPADLQQRISIVQQDVNDTDFLALLSTHKFQHLLFFCNNVAFNSGTIHR